MPDYIWLSAVGYTKKEEEPDQITKIELMAEDTGFEPAEPFGSTVFKTAAFDHSANPPYCDAY